MRSIRSFSLRRNSRGKFFQGHSTWHSRSRTRERVGSDVSIIHMGTNPRKSGAEAHATKNPISEVERSSLDQGQIRVTNTVTLTDNVRAEGSSWYDNLEV